MNLTFRTKLTLFYATIVAVLLTGFGVLYYHALGLRLEDALNTQLTERSEGLRGYLRVIDGNPTFVYDQDDPEESFFVRTSTRYFQIYDVSTGALLAQSPEVENTGLQYLPEEIQSIVKGPRLLDIQTDREKFRFRNELVSGSGREMLLQVGASLQTMEDTLNRFLELFVLLIPAGVVVAALAGWWMAGKALEPIRKITGAAREIALHRLDYRLPLRGTHDEIDNLASEFNKTLARLDDAVGEMKQFTASIAHELRTPLAILRGESEMALSQANTEAEYREVLLSQLEEFEKLTRMINQLLTLTRAESGEVAIARDEVNLSELVQSLVEQLEPVAASKNVELRVRAEGAVPVRGDAGWLERIAINLIDNAIKFTNEGRVDVSVFNENGQACFDVNDTGSGIPPEAIPHIFERFYRADPSRSSRVAGVGLGLSIAKWAVEQHGGTITAESNVDVGTRLKVRLPAL